MTASVAGARGGRAHADAVTATTGRRPVLWRTIFGVAGRHADLTCLIGVGLLALAIRLAFSFRAPPFITNDSLSYLLPGFDWLHGQGFAPILKRPPFYPAFVRGVLGLFGEELRVLMLVQHLLGVVTVLLTYAIGRLTFGTVAGLLAAILTAVSGPLIVTEHYLMSETLFGVLQAGGLLAYLGGVRSRRLGWLALAGLLLGLAALTRPIAQLVLAILLAALPLLLPRWRPVLKGGALLAGLFAVAVLPWMLRNQVVQGTFAVAGGSGEGLAVRTIRYEQRFDFREPPGGDPDRTTARARRIYRDEAEEGSAFELASRLRDELKVSEIEAERLMRTIALQAILRQPGYYLQGTAEMFVQTFVGRPARLRQDWTPWRNIAWEERVEHLLPAPTPVEDRAFATAERLVTLYDPARLAAPLALLGLLGMLAGLSRRRVAPRTALTPRPPRPYVGSLDPHGPGAREGAPARLLPPSPREGEGLGVRAGPVNEPRPEDWPVHRAPLLLGAIVLAVLLACAALIGVEYRYRYPLDPLIHVLAAGGLVTLAVLARAGWQRVSGRASVGPGAAPAGRPAPEPG